LMIAEQPGLIEEDDEEGALGLKDLDEAENRGIFARYHNSIVGHLGAKRTSKALSLGGHGWAGMHQNVTRMISKCSMCIEQKIKYQCAPSWEDAVDHYPYNLDSLTSLSGYAGSELGNCFIIVIVDNFSKLIGLYPARSTNSKELVHALLQWVSNFGVPKEIHIDGGSQFSSHLSSGIF